MTDRIRKFLGDFPLLWAALGVVGVAFATGAAVSPRQGQMRSAASQLVRDSLAPVHERIDSLNAENARQWDIARSNRRAIQENQPLWDFLACAEAARQKGASDPTCLRDFVRTRSLNDQEIR